MTDKEREMIDKLIDKSIKKEKFLKKFTVNIVENSNYIFHLFKKAINEKNGGDIELTFALGNYFNVLNNEHVSILCDLLEAHWHHSHEDIVSFFQYLKDPRSIECIYKTAQTKYEYLEYNDCYSLIVKCCWALGDINTLEAKEKLELLSQSDNEIIKEEAVKQLKRDIW